ncbi:hypothetical protein IM660_13635 [Ruania alkalisoli]|uniref:Fis family transcriptional regulator n=1 Tax=Ruania alkalisoli TaxID=2779775 RepID=A0A7M1SRV0_9MICO|nr:hypothetical protein [Ruania alkalisoli]QOR69704.1 hypothetical protein IM660_13635 [Ruania alkalisoli]
MRWDDVFAELQAQFDAALQADSDAELAELVQAEVAGIEWIDRCRARRGEVLTVRLADGSDRSGTVLEATRSWVRLALGERRCLIPAHAVVAAWPLGPRAPEPGPIEARLGLGHALRALAADGADVMVRSLAGDHRGRLTRVGADHLDMLTAHATVTLTWSGLLSVEST